MILYLTLWRVRRLDLVATMLLQGQAPLPWGPRSCCSCCACGARTSRLTPCWASCRRCSAPRWTGRSRSG